MDVIEFAGSPVAERHKTNFTHKDSLPFLFDDGDDEISPPPLEGGAKGGLRPPSFVRRTPMRSIGYGGEARRGVSPQ
jgi:hypothetical protein